MTTNYRPSARALGSYEARFTAGPDDTTRECTGCHYRVESVDSHGHCEVCEAAREARDEARDEAEAAAQRDAELGSDEGFTAWLAARYDAQLAELASEERALPHRAAA